MVWELQHALAMSFGVRTWGFFVPSLRGGTLRWHIAATLLACCGSMACGEEHFCSASFEYGLSVRVVGGAESGECAVTVVAEDGDYTEELECRAQQADCACYGAGERPGSYRVSLGDDSGVIESKTANVEQDEEGCHPVPVVLVFSR